MKLPFFIEQDEDGVRVAESPIFEGCITQGYNLQELQDNIEDVSQLYFGLLKDGESVLKGKYLISIGFDKHGKITNTLTAKNYLRTREKMISLAQSNG